MPKEPNTNQSSARNTTKSRVHATVTEKGEPFPPLVQRDAQRGAPFENEASPLDAIMRRISAEVTAEAQRRREEESKSSAKTGGNDPKE